MLHIEDVGVDATRRAAEVVNLAAQPLDLGQASQARPDGEATVILGSRLA